MSHENSDRFSQSAHSLREVTALIARRVSIPQEKKENKESLNKRLEKQFIERLELLPSPAEEKTRALIRKWSELNEFFISVAHHGKEVSEEEFLSKLSEFEVLSLQFLKPAPETLEELDSLLSVQSPTKDHIKRLSELLMHHTYAEYFFSRLASPDWLMPLKENGFFREPFEGILEGNYVMFPVWPLSKYLIKVAGQKPKEVMDIITSMNETDNFRVYIDLINCALQMPSSVAREIIPLVKKWITTPYSHLIPDDLVKLVVKLTNENEVEHALALLETLLDVKTQDRENELLLREAQSYLDLWTYEQILNQVVFVILKKQPRKVIEILSSRLSKAIELEKTDKSSSADDLSIAWRPAIENHEQNRERRDVKDLLLTTIRDSFEALGKIDEEEFRNCYQSLSKFDYPIFRRIELHLMRLFPNLLGSEIQGALSQKEIFEDVRLWHEYYHLLQEQYSNLPQNLKENILNWIEEGPDLERFESWFKQTRNTAPTQEEKDAHKAHWQITYLSVLKDVVPTEWKEEWHTLVAKYGEPEHPDFHIYTWPVQVGSTSPLTKEEIKTRSPQEVVIYLRTWKPSKDPLAPSREALAGILSEIVSENPSNYINICQEFKTLHPAYIFHLIEGFSKAIKKENAFDWNPVVSLCKDVLATSEPSKTQDDEGNFYDWKSIKREIANFLEEGLKSKTISPPFELREIVWEMVKILLCDNEPNLAFEKEYHEENMDSVTLSLNTVKGKAMHVLINYALWCVRCLNLLGNEDRMVPEVKEQLEKMLDPEFEPTKTIRAVYGLYLPNLFYLNKGWTKEHIPSIFPKDAEHRTLWRVAWEAYVTYCHLYNEIYENIRDQYGVAINKLESSNVSRSAKDKLSEHLMMAYLRGLEDLENESLIVLFFEKAQPETRGHAIWFIGRVLENLSKTEMNTNFKERLIKLAINLWEWRIEEAKKVDNQARRDFVQELKWFGTWFVNGPFDKTWAISQLNRTLELTKGELEFADDVIDNFPNYTKEHYLDVLKALTLLVKGDRQGLLLMLRKEKITELIESLIKEHLPQEIKDSVNDLVDNLTRRGHHDFAKFFVK